MPSVTIEYVDRITPVLERLKRRLVVFKGQSVEATTGPYVEAFLGQFDELRKRGKLSATRTEPKSRTSIRLMISASPELLELVDGLGE